jgi:SEL1 protein
VRPLALLSRPSHSLLRTDSFASPAYTDKKRLRLPILDAPPRTATPAVRQLDRLALTYWTRSAAQDNVDALVKMGDYYYAGLGTEDGVPQLEKAAGCYQSAATTRFSAMAMWNLGWMHEVGKGVPQVRDLLWTKDSRCSSGPLMSVLSRISTSPSATTTWRSRPRPTPSSRRPFRSSACTPERTKSGDDELRALSLFGRDPDPDGVGAGFAQHGVWNFGRAWRDIQRNWGVNPGPEPEAIHVHGQDPAAAEAGAGAGAGEGAGGGSEQAARRALEGEEDPMEWEGYRSRGNARAEGEEDEFYLEDEGDFGGTVAIVALSMLLA